MNSRLWVVPENDLEAKKIIELLGRQEESVLVSQQRWGAGWEGLERKIVEQLENFRRLEPEGEIYGVELSGKPIFGARNIDHHKYKTEDRRHPLSSIEQIAQKLGVELTREEKLVAANDKGWIPAMEEMGATAEEIDQVRRADREVQGLTPEDEERARREVAGAHCCKGLMEIQSAGLPNSMHTDAAYKKAEHLLVVSEEQWNYSGPLHDLLASLPLPEVHWSGGMWSAGYFVIQNPGDESKKLIRKVLQGAKADVVRSEMTLCWPVRLTSYGELEKSRADSEASPGKWLRKYQDWIIENSRRPNGAPTWEIATEEPTEASWDERQNGFAEFVYFHPFVHELFYRREEDSEAKAKPRLATLERKDLLALRVLLSTAKPRPRPEGSRGPLDPETEWREHPEAITLGVEKVELHLLLTDVAILSVQLSLPQGLGLHEEMHLLNEVRRVYPPYWGGMPNGMWPPEFRQPGQAPLLAQWIRREDDKAESAGAGLTCNLDREAMIRESEETKQPPLMAHWRERTLALAAG